MVHSGDERRRYPRSKRGISLVNDDSGPGVLNHIDNISANGVLCHTVKPIALMTRMRIVLELPAGYDNDRIDVEGIVVRCDADESGDDHFKVAILFNRLGDEDHEAICNYVEHDLSQTQISE